MFKALIGFTSLLLVSLALSACAETPPEPQQMAQATPAKVKTCQTDMETGSHMREKTVCVSDDEDAQRRGLMQQNLDNMSAPGK